MIHSHVSSFAGLDVRTFVPADPTVSGDPGDATSVAWRLEVETDSEGEFAALLEAFLAEVPGDSVRALVIGEWGGSYEDPAPIDALTEAAAHWPHLRALFLADLVSEEAEISWIVLGDLTGLLAALPRLTELRVRGAQGLAIGPLRHDALRELTIESGGLPGSVVRSIGASDLPALERLTLWLGREDYGGDTTPADLSGILTGEGLPALRHLGLANAENAVEVAAAVATAPVVARLETLDLSMGVLRDLGADALLAGQPLTHLRRLDLHHHFLTPETRERVRAALPGVDVDLSDPRQAEEYHGQTFYFTAVGE